MGRDIIGAAFTLSGSAPGEPAKYSPRERIDALAAAGVRHMGLHVDLDYDRWGTLADLARYAADEGVSVPELEFLVNWSVDGEPARSARITEDRIYEMADVFGADHVNVGIRENPGEMAPIEAVAERFAGLCDRAAGHDLRVAYEFMPFRQIDTLAAAWELIDLADRANGGILIDAWHFFRGPSTIEMLEPIPAEKIFVLQLCDGAQEPVGSLLEDTINHRRFPGEGAFDLPALLGALDAKGVVAPVSVEVLSAELRRDPLEVAARKIAAVQV
jgi:sugar phosphate isomerase/epimerase